MQPIDPPHAMPTWLLLVIAGVSLCLVAFCCLAAALWRRRRERRARRQFAKFDDVNAPLPFSNSALTSSTAGPALGTTFTPTVTIPPLVSSPLVAPGLRSDDAATGLHDI